MNGGQVKYSKYRDGLCDAQLDFLYHGGGDHHGRAVAATAVALAAAAAAPGGRSVTASEPLRRDEGSGSTPR